MATEPDETNTGVVLTALLVGAAAMLGGSAGLVALAKGELAEQGAMVSTNADLGSIKALKETQRAQLRAGTSPIEQAQAQVLARILKDANLASPHTVVAPAPESTGAAAAAPEGEPVEGEPVEGEPTAPGLEGGAAALPSAQPIVEPGGHDAPNEH